MKCAAAIVSCAALAACSTPGPKVAFDDVQHDVQARGLPRVHWSDGSPEDEAAARSVQELVSRDLTADSAVQIALLNNRSLQATYEELGLAQADLVRAGLLRNPVFNAEARFTGSGSIALELRVVESFLDVLYMPLRKKLAAIQLEQAKLRVTTEVLDLAARTRAEFVCVQATEQLREMRSQAVTGAAASYDLARRLRDAGNIAELDLSGEETLLEESRLDLATAEAEAIQGRELLNELMGLWGDQATWKLEARLPDVPADEASVEHAESRAVEASLELAVAKRSVEAAARRAGVARPYALLDGSEIGAAAVRDLEGPWSIGPSVALPIPIFDQGQSAEMAAASSLRRRMDEFYATAVRVRAEARAAEAAVVSARSRAVHCRDVVLPLHAMVVEETQKQYNAMQVGLAAVLEAKQRQVEASMKSVEALRDYWLARGRLETVLAGHMIGAQASSAPRSIAGKESADER